MKKIYVNGKFFCQRTTGTQRYARELLKHIDGLLGAEAHGQWDFEILVPPDAAEIPRYTNVKVRTVGKATGTIWEQLELPRFCEKQILFTPSGGAPVLYSRNVVTIHDAAVAAAPAGYSLFYRLWYTNVCRRMARTALRIFTVSQFSKSEIVKCYGAAPEKVLVVYLGSDHFADVVSDTSTRARLGISGKYVLAVSSHNPNKNFHRVVQAIPALNAAGLQLVIAGGDDSKIYRDILEMPDTVRALGYVNDRELKELYQGSSCFVFASLYEGFGLPPLEAMANGCPVVVSRVASLPEIFKDAAQYCDPYDTDDIAAAILRIVESPAQTVEERKNFARGYSWEKCARETLRLLHQL